jgi:aminoglycoside phosphotransferase (APT) family kinase protein
MSAQLGEKGPGVGLDVPVGPKLASGRDADVYDLGDGRVLRRYRLTSKMADGSSKTSELEAEIMRFVRRQGYPVPAVHAVSGPDLVMDRVDGPTMLRDLGQRPWMLWRHARTLAALHRRLHAIPAPDGVPTYASHPAFASTGADRADLAGAPAVEAGPAGAPSAAADTLLHLDLHPDNVILSRAGPMVIDWRNTRRGDAAIDVATTWLIMATSEVPGRTLRWRMISLVRRLFVYAFLRHADRQAAARQLPAVARYRLADRNLLASERPAIHALLRRNQIRSRTTNG